MNTVYKFTFEDGSQVLAHYGVLGMKWGVRNDESVDRERRQAWDTLDELSEGGVEEFYETGKIQGWTSKSGMRFYDKIPNERLTLGSDTTFTSYGLSEKDLSGGPLYTTWKPEQSHTYKNFGDTEYKLTPKKDIHVASMKDSYDTYTELFSDKSDKGSDFRKDVYSTTLGPWHADKVSAYAKAAIEYPEGAAAVSYRGFVHNQYRQTSSTKEFFSAMQSKGFDGILDQNDISDYKKESPVIVLDPANSLEISDRIRHSLLERVFSIMDERERSKYKFTFEDGSQFLAHHGTKGMHWGVWNTETAARYKGGYSNSVKGAKRSVRQLNRLDKRKAIETGKAIDSEKKANTYYQRAAKAITRKGGASDRTEKLFSKGDKALEKVEAHANASSGISKTQKEILAQVKKDGYSVSMKDVRRSTLTAGEKATQLALNAVAYAAGSPVLVSYDRKVQGTKYKLNKSVSSEKAKKNLGKDVNTHIKNTSKILGKKPKYEYDNMGRIKSVKW